MDHADRVRSELHLERCDKLVKELEKTAIAHARKGAFLEVIDAVEENIATRARWGSDSLTELVGMLQVLLPSCLEHSPFRPCRVACSPPPEEAGRVVLRQPGGAEAGRAVLRRAG